MTLNSKHTVGAACIGYLTQAITINFAPLLFITFQKEYQISMGKISLLIGISFFSQLLTDVFIASFGERLNRRALVIAAHFCAVIGMSGFAYFPEILPSAYCGLALSVIISAIGGGIIEVLVSPIVEDCPTKNKSSVMSFLHSFYCWGLAGVILLSTVFFNLFGIEYWRILACLWAIVPSVGAIIFIFIPIYPPSKEELGGENPPSKKRFSAVYVFFIMMFCAGASEQILGQWASSFAESGLGIPKSTGDILCPCIFALCMGISRMGYSSFGHKVSLELFVSVSSLVCVLSYLITAISPFTALSLFGCALCGLSVGIMWPGTYSLATKKLPPSVKTFALLAIAGDVGCLTGPSAAGFIAAASKNDLRAAFLVASIFPIITLISLRTILREYLKKSKIQKEKA